MIKLSQILALPAVLLLAAAAANAQTPAPAAASSTATSSATTSSTAGDAKHGKELFMKYTCYGCHGFSGQNGNGARLVPMRFPQAGFIAYVRNPPRANQMPSYSTKVLADKDLADIYAYIKTLPNSAPPAASVPILSQILRENQ